MGLLDRPRRGSFFRSGKGREKGTETFLLVSRETWARDLRGGVARRGL